jgi:hypothetical protein
MEMYDPSNNSQYFNIKCLTLNLYQTSFDISCSMTGGTSLATLRLSTFAIDPTVMGIFIIFRSLTECNLVNYYSYNRQQRIRTQTRIVYRYIPILCATTTYRYYKNCTAADRL